MHFMSEATLNPVIIFGAKGLGKAALEIFENNGVVVYGFLEDEESLHGTVIGEISILGNTEDQGYLKLIGKKCDAFVAQDENTYRENIVEMLNKRRKVMPINAIHSQAILANSSSIGHGNFINAGVILGAAAKIGNHCILHSRSLIEYEAEIGDFVQIGAGSNINAKVKIGKGAFIGSGVTIVAGVSIGENARVGAGSVVVQSVPDDATVFGNPAKAVEV